jgi:type IV pilus assembly protein PilW
MNGLPRKELSMRKHKIFPVWSLKRFSDKGFTITELMVATVVGMIILGVTYSTYISQQRAFTAQDQTAELNSTSKIALNIIANAVREAGFGVPDDGTFTINTFSAKITATDSSSGPDQLTIVGAFRPAGTLCSNGAGNAIVSNNTQIILAPPAGSPQLDNINTTDRRNISIGGLSFGIVTAGGGAVMTLTLQDRIGSAYPLYTDLNSDGNCDDGEGVPVYVIEDYTFRVVGTDLQRVMRLNGGSPATNVIAENIEDLQFAYGVDTNNDDVVDLYRNAPIFGDRVKTVRINILARSGREDMNFFGQGNPPAAIENHNLAASNDNLRRRWWQLEVDVRNPI